MTELSSTQPTEADATVATQASSQQELAKKLRLAWSQGKPLSLVEYLKQYPELCSARSTVIELAVDEYQLLQSQNQISSIGQYCEPFAVFHNALLSSISRQIQFEQYLDDHPELRLFDNKIRWPSAGDLIAGYRVQEELGRGALARAYLCSQIALGDRQVVVKVSSRDTREGHTLGKLQHPHIMPIHSIEVEAHQRISCLCTPFLGRSTLLDLIDYSFATSIPTRAAVILHVAKLWNSPKDNLLKSPSSSTYYQRQSYVHGILELAVKMCDALAYAHNKGIIHGDLKPSNVLLTPNGEPILLDFNLSRDEELTLDVRGGTLPYMSPEQIVQLKFEDTSGVSNCDNRSEIFSFGVVLYQLLSGQLPFEIDTESDDKANIPKQLLKKQQGGVFPLTKLNSGVSNSLSEKVRRCLAFDPEARFQSMGQLQAALQDELTLTGQFFRWSHQHRNSLLGILFCISLLVFSVNLWLQSRSPYYIREYHKGLAFQASDHLDKALSSFSRAVDAAPNFIEGKFEIARSNLAKDEVEIALEQFVDLVNEKKHAPSMAYIGYCYNLLKPHALAIPWYEKAIDAGLESAGIHNNLAVSYEQDSTTKTTLSRIEAATSHFKQALQLAPKSTSVRLNYARFEWQRFLADSTYVPNEGLKYIQVLQREIPSNPEVYLVGIRLYVAVAKTDSSLLDKAIDMLLKACQYGVKIDLQRMCRNPIQKVICKHPRFPELQNAVEHQSIENQPEDVPQFLDPLTDPS